jgi:hypothetical protein
MKWFNKIFDNSSEEQKQMPEEAQRWNRFIQEICFKEKSSLTSIQKAAVISFWYDAEMNSGGHSGYFDNYPEVAHEDLIWALYEVGGEVYADNYKEAVLKGSEDGYLKTDRFFYSIKPSFTYVIMDYVEAHAKDVFEGNGMS